MPRQPNFDPDEALGKALDVFWQNGFMSAGYDELVAATGASRKGLYSCFGNKEQLFLRCIDRYRTSVVPELFADVAHDKAGASNVARTIERIASLSASSSGAIGCFMVNTASGPEHDLEGVRERMASHLQQIAAWFREALERSGWMKEDAADTALYLCSISQALLLLARSQADPGFANVLKRRAIESLM